MIAQQPDLFAPPRAPEPVQEFAEGACRRCGGTGFGTICYLSPEAARLDALDDARLKAHSLVRMLRGMEPAERFSTILSWRRRALWHADLIDWLECKSETSMEVAA